MKTIFLLVAMLSSLSVFAAENYKVTCKTQWVYDQAEKPGATEALIQSLIGMNFEAGYAKVIAVNSNMVGTSNRANICVTSEK